MARYPNAHGRRSPAIADHHHQVPAPITVERVQIFTCSLAILTGRSGHWFRVRMPQPHGMRAQGKLILAVHIRGSDVGVPGVSAAAIMWVRAGCGRNSEARGIRGGRIDFPARFFLPWPALGMGVHVREGLLSEQDVACRVRKEEYPDHGNGRDRMSPS